MIFLAQVVGSIFLLNISHCMGGVPQDGVCLAEDSEALQASCLSDGEIVTVCVVLVTTLSFQSGIG